MTRRKKVTIGAGGVELPGTLTLPDGCAGLVMFSHGSGSSRLSPRNQYVAGVLNNGGLGTMLFDLLTFEEYEIDQYTREFRFDIDLLTQRLTGAVDWVTRQSEVGELAYGLFGSSTGAASALNTSARRPDAIRAVVSRGGRPDLAIPTLPSVRAPTLLIVGEQDEIVIGMNRKAAEYLKVECDIAIVSGATHLFEEPGALEKVACLARDWFLRFLAPAAAHVGGKSLSGGR